MDKLRLCLISDTHGKHDELIIPSGVDVLIHSGDVSNFGTKPQIKDFLDWFSNQDARYKIFCAGNHDYYFDDKHSKVENKLDIIPENVIYLQDSYVVIDGVKIYGTPWQPYFYNWAFNLHRGKDISEKWDLIENDCDIFISHGPPANISSLDKCFDGRHVGCVDLIKKIEEIKPTLVVFGHIHEGYGCFSKVVDEKEITFINASVLNERYEMKNKPVVVDFLKSKKINIL